MDENLLIFSGGKIMDVSLTQAGDLALDIIQHNLSEIVGDGKGEEPGEMPFNPGGEMFPHFAIRRVPGQPANNLAFFRGKQVNAPADFLDIEFNRSCCAPGRLLYQGMLTVDVAFVASFHIPGQEKADQDQRKNNQN
jgi:hypothetical protein